MHTTMHPSLNLEARYTKQPGSGSHCKKRKKIIEKKSKDFFVVILTDMRRRVPLEYFSLLKTQYILLHCSVSHANP